MTNPWLKKNPALSLWLSGANAVAGAMRGQAMAQMKRTGTTAASDALQLWQAALAPTPPAKKRTRRKHR